MSRGKTRSLQEQIPVRRKLVENLIHDEVNKQFATAEKFQLVLKKVEDEIKILCSHVPEQIRTKEN